MLFLDHQTCYCNDTMLFMLFTSFLELGNFLVTVVCRSDECLLCKLVTHIGSQHGHIVEFLWCCIQTAVTMQPQDISAVALNCWVPIRHQQHPCPSVRCKHQWLYLTMKAWEGVSMMWCGYTTQTEKMVRAWQVKMVPILSTCKQQWFSVHQNCLLWHGMRKSQPLNLWPQQQQIQWKWSWPW